MKHAFTNRSEPFAARMVRHSSERCLNRAPSTGVRLLRTNAVHGLDLIAVTVSTPEGCSACLTKPSNEALLTRSTGLRRPVERVSPGYFALREPRSRLPLAVRRNLDIITSLYG